MEAVRQNYQSLYAKFQAELPQIDNLNELYHKFKNLKLYEQEYDRNQDLKKELGFWDAAPKTVRQRNLEAQVAALTHSHVPEGPR